MGTAMAEMDGVTRHRGDRTLVVGAGFCGLGVGAALTRAGLPFDMVEADDALGGNWYRGVYDSVHIISSRKTTALKELPMPEDWPDFPSRAQMLAYLHSIADAYHLRDHLELGTRVEHLAPAADGRWLAALSTGETRSYASVVVANGHHWKRRWPRYEGDFEGELLHSRDYRNAAQLEGKRVLVIGGGNSACDIAVEAARVAKSAHISLRRGYWFMPKTMLGVPTVELMRGWMPVGVQRLFLRALLRVIVGRYQDYGLPAPDHRLFERHPTINDQLLQALRHGRVSAHPDVVRYHGRELELVNGRRLEIDLIVAATGYEVSVPFLQEGVLAVRGGVPQLVGGILPIGSRNLYVFGFGQPRYGAGPIISEASATIAEMIRVQPQLEAALSDVLLRLGQKPPSSMLMDPFGVMRQARRGRRLVRWLPRLQRLLGRLWRPNARRPAEVRA